LKTSGNSLYAPSVSACFSSTQAPLPYSFTKANNAGRAVAHTGALTLTADNCELVGWLVGAGTLFKEGQSMRFASSSAGSLHRVQRLVSTAFPGVSVKVYPKHVGFDLTLTGGIKNPLNIFLHALSWRYGLPACLMQMAKPNAIAFLRGLWGADGWMHGRKGGSDVDLGLARRSDDERDTTETLRLLHSLLLGMSGQIRTERKRPGHRLVFSGYRNYAIFQREIGTIGDKVLPAPPVSRPYQQPPVVAFGQTNWYEAPVQRVELLGLAQTYKVPQCLIPTTISRTTPLNPT
jgi:hypothetical protein